MIRQSGYISAMPHRKIFLSRTINNVLSTTFRVSFIIPELDIETTIDITETSDILYTDEQKYNYLFNKYPVLKEMKKNFQS